MKIGLVRHFKVKSIDPKGKISAAEFSQWMRDYDGWDVEQGPVDLRDIAWNKCYSSNLPRAIKTAQAIYDGEIIQSPLIREISMKFTSHMHKSIDRRVSLYEWSVYSMINWAKNTDQVEENLKQSRARVGEFLDNILKDAKDDDRILLVCHGMIMTVLEMELRKRDFDGETVIAAENGELFLFEK